MKTFEVKLSRIAISFYMGLGILMIVGAIGFSMAVGWTFDNPDANWLTIGLFYFFTIGCAGLIVGQQILYFLHPPTLMTLSDKEITFGTGFRYKQYSIPLKYVKKAEFSILDRHQLRLTGIDPFLVGVLIHFKPVKEIPASMATPIGVKYFMHTLKLSRLHMNKGIKETVDRVNHLANGD